MRFYPDYYERMPDGSVRAVRGQIKDYSHFYPYDPQPIKDTAAEQAAAKKKADEDAAFAAWDQSED